MLPFSETGRAVLKCPFCKSTSFYTILLKYQTTFHDGDLLPHAEGFDDLLLSIHECPKCGGCFSQDEFFQEEIKKIKPSITLIPKIKNLVAKHEFPGEYVNRFLFCAYFMELHGSDEFIKAHCWHQAAWASRVRLNEELELLCLEKALTNYKNIYQDPKIMKKQLENQQELEHYIPFIIGEISRRLGYFDDAEIFFRKVSEPPLSELAKKLVKLAKRHYSCNIIIELAFQRQNS